MSSARGEIEDALVTLCQSCGLCCDGSLFGRVTIQPEEVRRARKNHLHVLAGGNAFEQPCSALSTSDEHCACSIYAARPRSCRVFTCRLYDRHRREGGPLEVRLEAVRRVRMLLRFVETTVDAEDRGPAIAELTRRMETDFARGTGTGQESRVIPQTYGAQWPATHPPIHPIPVQS